MDENRTGEEARVGTTETLDISNGVVFWREVDKRLASAGNRRPWLAVQTGLPLGRINNWVNRQTLPRVDEGVKIAEALQTSCLSLLTGRETIPRYDLPPDVREMTEAYTRMAPKDRQLLRYICRAVFRLLEEGLLSIPADITPPRPL